MRNGLMTLLLATPVMAGCSTITSTTNTTARTLDAGLKATTQSTESMTESEESADYADARRFVDSQFVIIRREIANGGGEHTAALARLMGASDVAAFNDWLQSNYAALFTDLSGHGDLVARIAASHEQVATTRSQTDA